MKTLTFSSLCLLAGSCLVGSADAQAIIQGRSGYKVEPRLGAVASETDICSRIGTNLLKAGGNAADAVSLSVQFKFARRRSVSLGWGFLSEYCGSLSYILAVL